MQTWMRKLAVTLIAIVTLGMYTPTTLLEIDAEGSKNGTSSNTDLNQNELTKTEQALENYENVLYEEIVEEDYLSQLQEQAKMQSLLKFGPRIAEQVEDEFSVVILPQMEAILEDLYAEAGEEVAPYYAISEKPAKGYGERIFNVTDGRTGDDIAKFHVRRDNRPLDGYYFNFHYHLNKDEFKSHHNIGDIYWDKNTPPKWMA